MARLFVPRVPRSAGRLRMVAAAVTLVALAAMGCHSLDVANPNDPDVKRALANGGDIESLLGGAFSKWFFGMTEEAPGLPTAVMADHYESAWGNWGMKLLGWEPRDYELTNSTTDAWDDFRQAIENPWYEYYGALVAANLTLNALSNGVPLPGPGAGDTTDNAMVKAASTFIQGATLANVALQYDSGYAFDETYDPTGPALELVGRDSVKKTALRLLDKAITLASASGANWKIPATFLNQVGYAWTNTQLAQVANTWAARLIADFPDSNSATQNSTADWAAVAAYASKGISSGTPFDMASTGDQNNWYNLYVGYGEESQVYIRVNFRTICLMDPNYWCHRPNNADVGLPPQSPDWRFNGDGVVGDNCVAATTAAYFNGYGQYCSDPSGYGTADFMFTYDPLDWTGYPASRGYWRFSHVGHVRYFDYGWDSNTYLLGKQPFVLAAENDLLWAEGLVRSGGDLALAAQKINNTRVTRGHLPAMTGSNTPQELLDAIAYEYGVELFATDPTVDWMFQRRSGGINPHYYDKANDSVATGWTPFGTGLQPHTPRLFPVPAKELLLLGKNIYTYGGPNNPEGASPDP
jgi:hypothetical protein